MWNKKILSNLVMMCAVTGLVSGCASTKAPIAKTDFLKHYQSFKASPNADDAWVSTTPYFDINRFKGYQKIAIAPVSLWLEQEQAFQIKDKEKQHQLKKYLEQVIKKQLSSSKQLVDVGTKDSLHIKLAITYLGERSPELEPLDILPFRVVINSGELAYLAATNQKESIGQASLEVEFVDTNTGNKLAAAIIKSEQDEMHVDDVEDNIQAIKPILHNWAERLLKALSAVSSS